MPKKQQVETIDTRALNSTDSKEQLTAFIERAERLNSEKADIGQSLKEVFAEAKGAGYDTKVLRKIIAERKRDRDDVAEEEALLEMYRAALGMVSHYDVEEDSDSEGLV